MLETECLAIVEAAESDIVAGSSAGRAPGGDRRPNTGCWSSGGRTALVVTPWARLDYVRALRASRIVIAQKGGKGVHGGSDEVRLRDALKFNRFWLDV